jgi:DNA mismatch endonuclease (patch repair protein)
MSDVFEKAKRSKIMSRVRSRENKNTEIALVTLFRKHVITGWRRRMRVFGSPDFIFRKQRVAVFVDGCFWHSCPKHRSTPESNRTFWNRKLQRNKARDQLVSRTLRKNGWKVIRVWQHELKRANHAKMIARIRRALVSSRIR